MLRVTRSVRVMVASRRLRAVIGGFSAGALVASTLLPTVAAAQRSPAAGTIVHEEWTVERGLPVNSVTQVVQGLDGYLWLATYDGLVRFDGVRFTVFTVENSPGLPSSRIVHLRLGRDGALWLFTEQQQVVRYKDGTFRHYAELDGRAEARRQLIAEAGGGRVWISSMGRLHYFADSAFVAVPLGIGRGGRERSVTSLLIRGDSSLLIATASAELLSIRPDSPTKATAAYADMLPIGAVVTDMFEARDRALWLSTDSVLYAGRGPFAVISQPGTPMPVRTLHTLPDGTTWVQGVNGTLVIRGGRVQRRVARGYYTAGEVMWREQDDVWYAVGPALYRNDTLVYRLAPDMPSGAPSPYHINTVLRDREGNIWLGTDAAGLHRLAPALFRTYSAAEGLASQNVHPIFVDRAGMVWTGAWGDGASKLNPSTGRATALGVGGSLPYHVNTFLQDRDGTFWVGTSDRANKLYRCRAATDLRNCTAEPLATPVPADLRVVALHRDAAGALWAGTSGGVFRRTPTGGWQRLDVPPQAATATFRAFAETRDGALWMATDKSGVLRYQQGRFTAVTTRDGLPINAVRALHVDVNGYLWIGTEGRGLAGLDPRAWATRDTTQRTVIAIGVREGLFDNVVHAIVPDDRDQLWMSSNRGIFWLARRELLEYVAGRTRRVHSTGYTERDGMRNREANGGVQPAASKGPDGRLWFATQDGVVVVNPADAVRRDSLPLRVVVEQVTSRDSVVSLSDGRARLGVAQRDVQFTYTALTFVEPQNVRFRYQLDGYDVDWVDAGDRRTAFYTKVPPGTYTFRVQASMPSSDWTEDGAELTLTVTPRLWERPLVRVLLALLLVAAVVSTVRWRLHMARGRARVLEQTVAERTKALQARERELATQNSLLEEQAKQLQALDRAKTRFFANVSHELRTPLTLTIGPLEDLRAEVHDDERVARWLDIAQRNARRLLRLVNQILDVAKLEAGEMRLAPRQFDAAPFVRGLVAAFAPVADRKALQLHVQGPDSIVGLFDGDALEKILTNLVSNAVKFTPDGGRVLVTVASTPPSGDDGRAHLEVQVADSGTGIPAEQLAHVFERFYQVDETQARLHPGTGIGLALVKELVELHGGTISVASDLRGTVFTLRIPYAPVHSNGTSGARAAESAMADLALTPATGQWMGTAPLVDGDADAIDPDVRTLLIVDDSSDLRAYVRSHFADRFRVIEARDGDEGVAIARRELPDVVLSDVMMPGRDGHALVRDLRASPETDFLPIILLTAQADGEQRIAGLAHGADDYVVKPFEMRELELRVRNLIASRDRLRDRLRERLRAMGSDADRDVASIVARTDTDPVADTLHVALVADEPMELTPAPRLPTPPIDVLLAMERLGDVDRAWLERLREVLRGRLEQPEFGVSELADAMNTDRTTLFRRTRQLLSLAPSDLLRQSRLAAGARLLASDSTSTVADVAYAVGFNSVSHFCHCFQQLYGQTPATYRAGHTAVPQ
jgi:signal transduction histidine kinase/ligand-binding sensor domain-containing protein/DNA-binding response OmpR family regulator